MALWNLETIGRLHPRHQKVKHLGLGARCLYARVKVRPLLQECPRASAQKAGMTVRAIPERMAGGTSHVSEYWRALWLQQNKEDIHEHEKGNLFDR